ncbi:sigma-70 family RNA polymerase sigma factor [Desulfolutivibrio sp.]|uniref:sigma-70 family RNA polymerase sigma factor n=1 Tax=Desulfolutivibrio sp. TaxID=2773296 RepID=UPI002F962189
MKTTHEDINDAAAQSEPSIPVESEDAEELLLEPGDPDEPDESPGLSGDVEVDSAHLPAPLDFKRTGMATRDPLQLYLREISKFPMLAQDEEFDLARKVRDQGDQDAAFRLVSSHLRLVVKIAMDFQRRWMQNVLDLIQEGNVGLMRAVKKYDPEKGIKFSYYAAYWIKAYILKYIMDNWRLVKIGTTQAQRKLFYNLNKERQRLQTMGFTPSTSKLSESLNVSESEILEMEQRLSGNDMSLDVSIGEDSSASRIDFLPALTPGIEEMLADDEISRQLEKHIATIRPRLSDKERDLLENRILSDSPLTLREIGAKYGITRERVRQIESRLLEKLKEHLSNKIEDFSADWIKKYD